MSAEHVEINTDSKFTKGEKCIFLHVIVTFLLIIVLVIIYFVHLIIIEHPGNEEFRICSRFHPIEGLNESPFLGYKGIGMVFLNTTPGRSLCNSMLVREQWSVAPGHCVAARSDPDLANLLPFWVIKYRNNEHVESIIKRSIIHPHFNIDDFDNNIGLFEHNHLSEVPQYVFPTTSIDHAALFKATTLEVVSCDLSDQDIHDSVKVKTHVVSPVSIEECQQYTSPIVDLRSHEFCVRIGKRNVPLGWLLAGCLICRYSQQRYRQSITTSCNVHVP